MQRATESMQSLYLYAEIPEENLEEISSYSYGTTLLDTVVSMLPDTPPMMMNTTITSAPGLVYNEYIVVHCDFIVSMCLFFMMFYCCLSRTYHKTEPAIVQVDATPLEKV